MFATSSTLHRGLANYKHKEAARTDIEAAARTYPSLPVKFQSFTFDDGTTCDLLSLDGTLPVTYDRRTYNIPVAIFFLSAHPHMPPMVYVRPTSSMEIKKGKNVDVSGRVYLPYLSNWKHPQSNTIQLLHLLSEAFGQNPPVYSKQPACPSPPTGSVGPPSVGFQTYPATQAAAPNGYPPYYPQPGSAWVGSGQMPPIPSSTPPVGMPMMPPHPTPPPSAAGTGLYPQPAYAAVPTEDPVLLSLRSAVAEKLHRQQQKLVQRLTCEIEALEATDRDLNAGREKLDIYRAQMASELTQVKQVTSELEKKTQELRDAYHKLKKEEEDGQMNFDDVVSATAPVYRQLVDAFAEEQAIDDVIYYLGQALHQKVIDLDVFLKTVRAQSRRQFMLRATVLECRKAAGLPPV
ncbi:hypothetical protein AAHC03_016439 [Spirometra sp. Aus1]